MRWWRRTWAAKPRICSFGTWPSIPRRTTCTCPSSAVAATGQAVLVRIGALDGSISDVAPGRRLLFRRSPSPMPPTVDDERLDTTLPLGPEGEEFQFGERTIRLLRRPIRTSTITDMASIDGLLLVAGLSNEEFSSKLRRFPFPFGDEGRTTVSRSFTSLTASGRPRRRSAPSCPTRGAGASWRATPARPIVHFPSKAWSPGAKTVGRTVAELGAANQPLDMITFVDQGEEHLLVANSAHGLIKIARRDIDAQEPLTEPNEPVGVPRETTDYQGVIRLANIAADIVLALVVDDDGRHHLRSLKTSSL